MAEFDWETFDNPHKDDRVTITADDVAEILEGDERGLTKADAAKALQALTGAGQTTCYGALKPDGHFSKELRETHGFLRSKA